MEIFLTCVVLVAGISAGLWFISKYPKDKGFPGL